MWKKMLRMSCGCHVFFVNTMPMLSVTWNWISHRMNSYSNEVRVIVRVHVCVHLYSCVCIFVCISIRACACLSASLLRFYYILKMLSWLMKRWSACHSLTFRVSCFWRDLCAPLWYVLNSIVFCMCKDLCTMDQALHAKRYLLNCIVFCMFNNLCLDDEKFLWCMCFDSIRLIRVLCCTFNVNFSL